MIQHLDIYSERRDTQHNLDRVYATQFSRTLFGDVALTRRWGRLGTRGRSMINHLATETEAWR